MPYRNNKGADQTAQPALSDQRLYCSIPICEIDTNFMAKSGCFSRIQWAFWGLPNRKF